MGRLRREQSASCSPSANKSNDYPLWASGRFDNQLPLESLCTALCTSHNSPPLTLLQVSPLGQFLLLEYSTLYVGNVQIYIKWFNTSLTTYTFSRDSFVMKWTLRPILIVDVNQVAFWINIQLSTYSLVHIRTMSQGNKVALRHRRSLLMELHCFRHVCFQSYEVLGSELYSIDPAISPFSDTDFVLKHRALAIRSHKCW